MDAVHPSPYSTKRTLAKRFTDVLDMHVSFKGMLIALMLPGASLMSMLDEISQDRKFEGVVGSGIALPYGLMMLVFVPLCGYVLAACEQENDAQSELIPRIQKINRRWLLVASAISVSASTVVCAMAGYGPLATLEIAAAVVASVVILCTAPLPFALGFLYLIPISVRLLLLLFGALDITGVVVQYVLFPVVALMVLAARMLWTHRRTFHNTKRNPFLNSILSLGSQGVFRITGWDRIQLNALNGKESKDLVLAHGIHNANSKVQAMRALLGEPFSMSSGKRFMFRVMGAVYLTLLGISDFKISVGLLFFMMGAFGMLAYWVAGFRRFRDNPSALAEIALLPGFENAATMRNVLFRCTAGKVILEFLIASPGYFFGLIVVFGIKTETQSFGDMLLLGASKWTIIFLVAINWAIQIMNGTKSALISIFILLGFSYSLTKEGTPATILALCGFLMLTAAIQFRHWRHDPHPLLLK